MAKRRWLWPRHTSLVICSNTRVGRQIPPCLLMRIYSGKLVLSVSCGRARHWVRKATQTTWDGFARKIDLYGPWFSSFVSEKVMSE